MSTSSSPRRTYFSSMYDRDEPDFLDCPYDPTSFAMNNTFRTSGINTADQRQQQHNVMHPLTHHSHPQPQSPLFYHQNYSGYPFYSTGYYPNALGITPCQENSSTTTSNSTSTSSSTTTNAAAVAVAAASSTAAAAAAAINITQHNNTIPAAILILITINNNNNNNNNTHQMAILLRINH
ncbi:hypothetical protein G6F42_027253 [Rhizopus arrhizus]|nr:hypothetical protein G6F42_027253 [Rhizopus arrhizus]